MKTGRKDISDNGLFTMSRLGPEKLTHAAMEGYLAKGRCLHAAYVWDLFIRLWRLLEAGLVRTVRWTRSTINSTRAAWAERYPFNIS